jgi:peptide-methionine (R)-S-oxide reductase
MTSTAINRRHLLGAAALTTAGIVFATRSGLAAATGLQVTHTPAEWRKLLGAERYNVLRQEGTEPPFSSPLLKEKRRGIYVCAGCALPVFPSTAKFDSHTGWPSFWRAIPGAVVYKRDTSLFMDRTEEHCRRCGGHLGHVFDDGPPPTGKRHCINGLSLNFRPA